MMLDRLMAREGPHTLTRPSLLRLLDELEPRVMQSGGTALLRSGEPPDSGWRWLPGAASASGTGLALIQTESCQVAVVPPFPVTAATPGVNGPLARLRDLLQRKRLVAVVLLRLGAYAVGVLNDGQLVLSKTGTRYVHGRHRAGGQSQRRFQRNREKWIRELFDEACGVCRSRLAPYAGELRHLAIGGDQHVLGQFLKRCEWLEPLAECLLSARVPVRRPGLTALQRAGRSVWSSQVYVRCRQGDPAVNGMPGGPAGISSDSCLDPP